MIKKRNHDRIQETAYFFLKEILKSPKKKLWHAYTEEHIESLKDLKEMNRC